MKSPQCLICRNKNNLLRLWRKWICIRNSCSLAYYQQIGWLTTADRKKTGRPRLHSFASEAQRRAHYRTKKRDKISSYFYYKKNV